MQSRRDRVMKSFRAAQIQVLVATDVASRGLDVMEISHIVNYDLQRTFGLRAPHRPNRADGQPRPGRQLRPADEGKTLTEIEKLINEELRALRPLGLFPNGSCCRAAAGHCGRNGPPARAALQ
jgi:ATP-dependent RNA helicase DeaD